MTQGGWYQDPWGRWLPYPQQMPKTGTPGTGPLPLHPMGLGDILDGAFRLYRANFKSILVVVAVIDGPVQFLSALLQRNQFGGQSIFTYLGHGITEGHDNTISTSATVALLLVTAINYLIAQPFTGGAVSRLVSASYMGSVEAPAVALKAVAGKSIVLVVAALCVHLVEWTTGVFLILPGLIFMAMFVSVAPAIMVEGLGPFAGLGRSWSLSRGRVWRVLGVALLCGIIVSIVGSIVADPFTIAAAAIGFRWGWILVFVGGLLSSLVSLALNAVVATLIYFDGRIRHEGFDLQILARGVGV